MYIACKYYKCSENDYNGYELNIHNSIITYGDVEPCYEH